MPSSSTILAADCGLPLTASPSPCEVDVAAATEELDPSVVGPEVTVTVAGASVAEVELSAAASEKLKNAAKEVSLLEA